MNVVREPTHQQRSTFAEPLVDLDARRMASSTRALAEFDLFGIESGALKELVTATMALTAWVERIIEWHSENPGAACSKGDGKLGHGGGVPCSPGQLRRLAMVAHKVYDARAALKPRG